MAGDANHDQYRKQFEQVAAKYDIEWTSRLSTHRTPATTRAFHTAAPPNADAFIDVEDLIHFNLVTDFSLGEHVCVVENISLEWIIALGKAWNVPPMYFVYYLRNDGAFPTWATALEREEHQTSQLQPCAMRGHFISESRLQNDNHIQRFSTRHAERGVSGTKSRIRSCISFIPLDGLRKFGGFANWNFTDKMHKVLILVDASPSIAEICGSSGILFETLSTPHPHGHAAWDFLCGPPYHDPSLAGAIFDYCKDKDQRHLLLLWHQHGGGHKKDLLLMALMTFSWRRCLDAIALELAQVSFGQIRSVNSRNLNDFNDRLHRLREDLSRLKQVIPSDQNLFCIDPSCAHNGDVAKHYSSYKIERTAHWNSSEEWPSLKGEILHQEDILVQTFQILHSTISIRESQTSIELARHMAEEAHRSAVQARRGQLLTYLAFIYAPLSFVTSIYGMNVREINDSPLSVWVCFVALAVVISGTLMIWLAFRAWERLRLGGRVKKDGDKDVEKMA